MLQRIKDLPLHVAGIHATGKIEDDDFKDVIEPIIEEKAKAFKAIYYLLVIETNVSNFTYAAWCRDLKLMLKYYLSWKKIAIVSDQQGVEWFTDCFRYIIPGKSRHFPLEKLDEAVRWISEK